MQIFVKIKRMISKERQVMRRKMSKKTQSYIVHHYWWLTRINKLMNIWKEFNVFYKVKDTFNLHLGRLLIILQVYN